VISRAIGRGIVVLLEKADEAVDEVLYRPALVKAFDWLPRWWQCDLARLSMRVDERWQVGWWDDADIVIGGPCEACGRRASYLVYGERDEDDDLDPIEDFFTDRPVYTCGWCRLEGTVESEADLRRELAAARARSVSWRWR
jgi:hypothetical protein